MRLMATAFLMLVLASLATAAGAASPRDARAFAHEFDQAQIRRDLPTLQKMIADDLVFIPRNGEVQGKREFIDGYSAPTLRLEPITILHPTYVQLGHDAAVVGGEVVLRGREDDKAFVSHFRYADTFVWRDGRWQVVHVQVTGMTP